MKHRRVLAALLAAALGVGTTGLAHASDPLTAAVPATRTPAPGSTSSGLAQLLAAHDVTDLTTGIATLGAIPSALDVSRLSALGLEVQPMHQLPLAVVYGTTAAMKLAVTSGVVNDVYP